MASNQNYTHISDEGVSHSLARRVLRLRTPSNGMICSSKSINQWSYYKPVRSALYGTLTEAQRRQMLFDTNDGFTIPVFGSPKDAVEALEGGSAAWTYNRPRGGDYSEYYRLDDFLGYYTADMQMDWFKGWKGIEKGSYANTYVCYMPNIPVVGFYGMIENFAAWPKTNTSGGAVSQYRVGFIAWVVGDSQKKAYFVNFGKLADVQNRQITIDTTADNVPLGVNLKIAPVITSYGFGSNEPGVTDPSQGLDLEYIATWNECYLTTPVGSNTKHFFEKANGWWIMPVEPVQIRLEGSGTVTRPGLPDTVKATIVNGYPRYEKVYVEGVYTGYRVYLKFGLAVDAREEDIKVRASVRVNFQKTPQWQYIFETTMRTRALAAVDLPIAATNNDYMLSFYSGNSRYDSSTHELEMFVAKENYYNNGIQLEINVWAQYNHGEGETDIRPTMFTPDTF